LMEMCTKMGMAFTHAAPARYQPPAAWRALAEENCRASGGRLLITDDIHAAVRHADFLYTDLWWWIGQEAEIEDRRSAFMPAYQVTPELMRHAPPGCKFMHCLPASRGVEVTDAVIDSVQSIVFPQAENRLHTEMGLLVWLLLPGLKHASDATRRSYETQARALLAEAG
jgi:putrescine carbamoyltransferase